MKNPLLLSILICISTIAFSQEATPSVYTNITHNAEDGYTLKWKNQILYEIQAENTYNLESAMGQPVGTEQGFDFDFQSSDIHGTLYFGFIDFETARHPQTVFFKRPVNIENGKASINILQLSGKYDMVGWKKSGKGRMGYRVELDNGIIYYDGVLAFEYSDGFKSLPAVVEGPILQMLTDSSVVIKFKTNLPSNCKLLINDKAYDFSIPKKDYEFFIEDLKPSNSYKYKIICRGFTYSYELKTAPMNGSRKPFTFAYASDSRAGKGGGERHIWGTNAYIVKKSVSLALQQNAAFMQFTGDLITGYSTSQDDMKLQYANFKKVISPFTPYMPVYAGVGNHEVLERRFKNPVGWDVRVNRFPFDTESMEALFAQEFANHRNGPASEDGMPYDPDPNKKDFPTYKENVYFYTYDNVAMIVLNSEYLYAPSLDYVPETSGGLHGYLMDGQLKWLEETLQALEINPDIDHILLHNIRRYFQTVVMWTMRCGMVAITVIEP
jgi:hypothetical protein